MATWKLQQRLGQTVKSLDEPFQAAHAKTKACCSKAEWLLEMGHKHLQVSQEHQDAKGGWQWPKLEDAFNSPAFVGTFKFLVSFQERAAHSALPGRPAQPHFTNQTTSNKGQRQRPPSSLGHHPRSSGTPHGRGPVNWNCLEAIVSLFSCVQQPFKVCLINHMKERANSPQVWIAWG